MPAEPGAAILPPYAGVVSSVLNELRERLIGYLSRQRVCVIATGGSMGGWAAPARYENRDLALNCLLPRWADAVFHIEQNPDVLVIVQDLQVAGLRWIQLQGRAELGRGPDERYVAVRVDPHRLDLFDESLGWGARETLEI